MSTLVDKLTKDLEHKECITLKMSDGTKIIIDPSTDKPGIVIEQNMTWIQVENKIDKTETLHNLNLIQSIIIEYK